MKETDSKITNLRLSNKNLRTLSLTVTIFIILFCMKVASAVMIPIVFAIFVLLILFPFLDKLDKIHTPFWLSNLLALILFLSFITGVGALIFILIQNLIIGLPPYANKIAMLDKLLTQKVSSLVNIPVGETLLSNSNIDWINVILTSISNISSQFATIIKNVILIILFLFFLLMERQTLIPKVLEAFATDKSKIIVSITEKTTRQISRYLFLKFTISGVTGILFYLTAIVTGLDFAVLWGLMAFILNFIPSIGSLIVTLATICMAIIQFTPDVVSIIYVAVLAVAIQTVLGNIIDPKLQGIQLGLSPFVLLISLSLWGFIWGIPGMFLAVPLTSIIQILCINVPEWRGFAIMLSNGKSIQRRYKEEYNMAKTVMKKKGRGKKFSKEDYEKQEDEKAKNSNNLDDFILPDNIDWFDN